MTSKGPIQAIGWRKFEELVGKYLNDEGLNVNRDLPVEISINGIEGTHKFDWSSDTLLVECKANNWLGGQGEGTNSQGNYPGSKIAAVNESLLYFIAATKQHDKKLFMVKTEKRGELQETFAQYYVRRFQHLIPKDVKVYEFDTHSKEAECIWPSPFE